MYLDKIIKETFLNEYFSKIAFNNLKEISRYINKLTSYKNQAILFEFDSEKEKQIDISFAINKKLPFSDVYGRKKEVDFDQLLKSSLEFISIFPTATNFLEFDYKDSGYTLSGIFQKIISENSKNKSSNLYIYRYLNNFTNIELDKLKNFCQLNQFLENFDAYYIGLMNRSDKSHIVKIVSTPIKYNNPIKVFFNKYFKNSFQYDSLIKRLCEEFNTKLSLDFDLKENLISNRLCFEIFSKGIINKMENLNKLENINKLEKLFYDYKIYFDDQDINIIKNLPIKKRKKIFENATEEYYESIELFLSHIKLVIKNNQVKFKIYIWGNREVLKEIK